MTILRFSGFGKGSICRKKGKTITIKSNEGHGIDFGPVSEIELQNIPICRFQYPRFPLNETRLILGVSNDIDDGVMKKRKEDLNRIMKFLLRQTFDMDSESWKKLKNLDFVRFLYHVGMFEVNNPVMEYLTLSKIHLSKYDLWLLQLIYNEEILI